MCRTTFVWFFPSIKVSMGLKTIAVISYILYIRYFILYMCYVIYVCTRRNKGVVVVVVVALWKGYSPVN